MQDLDYFYNPDIDLELDEIMSKLKAKERALLALRIIEDRDFAEVALILNITPATARKRFERVKVKVQKSLKGTIKMKNNIKSFQDFENHLKKVVPKSSCDSISISKALSRKRQQPTVIRKSVIIAFLLFL